MAFSGGTYEDVGRWLANFLVAHAKRVDPRIEVELDAGGPRAGKSYGAVLLLGDRRSERLEFDHREVADHRGSLAWCRALAERVQGLARELAAPTLTGAAAR